MLLGLSATSSPGSRLEIADIEPIIVAKDVEDTVKCFLLQDPSKDGGESVLPLFWLCPHGGELPGAQPKQEMLELRRKGARCEVMHKETAVLPLLR